jgi:hypothetical protein
VTVIAELEKYEFLKFLVGAIVGVLGAGMIVGVIGVGGVRVMIFGGQTLISRSLL